MKEQSGNFTTSASTWLAFGCLLFLGLFIFSNTNGDLSIYNDDIFFIDYTKVNNGYLGKIAGRGFLTPYYRLVYELMGKSVQATHLFNFGLLAGSTLICWAVARRLLTKSAAVIVPLFYMACVAKYDIVTDNSAGGYMLVSSVLFISVLLAIQTGVNPWVRGGGIALLNWATAHLYEVLIVVAPLYPILVGYKLWREKRPLISQELFASMLPLAAFLAHWLLIWSQTPTNLAPIWVRQPTARHDIGYMVYMVGYAFIAGLGGAVGLDHFKQIGWGLSGFFSDFVPKSPYVVITCVISAAMLGIYGWKLARAEKVLDGKKLDVSRQMLWIAGLYMTLLTSLVAFTLLTPGAPMPSRILILPSIGMALLLALAVEWAQRQEGRLRSVIIGAVCLLIFAEAVALHSVITEFQTSWAFDKNIREQVRAFGLKPKLGDTIFISLPPNTNYRKWRYAPSEFECGSAQSLLLLDYGMVAMDTPVPCHDRLAYMKEVRASDEAPLNLKLEQQLFSGSRTFYPFILQGNDQKLYAIREIEVVDGNEKVLRKVVVPSFEKWQTEKAVVARANAVYLSYPLVNTDRQLYLNHYGPDLNLKIEGRPRPNSADGVAELWQGNRLVDSRPVGQKEGFSWEISLGKIEGLKEPLTLKTHASISARKSTSWVVDRIFLVKNGNNP